MNERFKKIRTDAGLTQDTFGSKLGMTRGYIAQIEMGLKIPSDRMIKDLCRQFKVNEEWLRNGDGNPYIEKTRNQDIAEFVNDVMSEVDESFRKKLILTLSKMTVEEWELLERKLNELYNM